MSDIDYEKEAQLHGSAAAAARHHGIAERTYRNRLYAQREQADEGAGGFEAGISREGITRTGDTCTYSGFIDKVITEQDAIRQAGLDMERWQVVEFSCTSWPTSMKLCSGDRREGTYKERPHQSLNWRVFLKCRLRASQSLLDALDELHKRMEKWSPRFNFPRMKKVANPHLYVPSLVDHHLGKLCWKPETGNDYDLRIAESLFMRAGTALLSRIQGCDIERFMLPIGNDFMHIDSFENTTTRGTRQDVDSRYPKVVAAAAMGLIRLVDLLAQVAPVDLMLVQGNHDLHAAYHIAREMAAYYRNTERVTVDHQWNSLKSYEYGTNLLGLAHGDSEQSKKQSLANFMPNRWPHEWARTTCHEWLMGHWHTQAKKEYLPIEEKDNVVIRTLPSLTGTDAWHYRNLYYSRRAAEGLLYSKKWGYSGTWQVGIDELQELSA